MWISSRSSPTARWRPVECRSCEELWLRSFRARSKPGSSSTYPAARPRLSSPDLGRERVEQHLRLHVGEWERFHRKTLSRYSFSPFQTPQSSASQSPPELALSIDKRRLRFMTFHSAAAELLTRYGRFVGLPPRVRVADKLEERLVRSIQVGLNLTRTTALICYR